MSETKICRICLEPDDDVLSVCRCSGTSEWVHKACIREWVTRSGNKKCEICHGDLDFLQIGVSDVAPDEEIKDRRCPVSNLTLWLSGVLSVSQSVACWCSIQYNAESIKDIISMGVWFNIIHLLLWFGELSRDEAPFRVSIIWLLGTVVPFAFLQVCGNTFESPSSLFFLELNIMISFVGALSGICVASEI